MKAIRSLHSIPGWFKKVRTEVAKQETTFQKNLKDPGFKKTAKIRKFRKMFHG